MLVLRVPYPAEKEPLRWDHDNVNNTLFKLVLPFHFFPFLELYQKQV